MLDVDVHPGNELASKYTAPGIWALLEKLPKLSWPSLAQHYRDRSDSENNFDELKNQWDWGGFTTQDLKRCRIMAKITALIYDWWSLFIRLIYPNKHTEAITSRPLMLQVGWQINKSC
jgi:hypothetical protein